MIHTYQLNQEYQLKNKFNELNRFLNVNKFNYLKILAKNNSELSPL